MPFPPFSPSTALWRTIFFYFFLLLMVRLTGKHSLGRLSPFDFVVTIMLAEAATLAIEDQSLPVTAGVIPIVTLVTLEILLSYAALKLPWLRVLMNGRPTVVIRHGKIDEDALRRLRYNLGDLLEGLRTKNISDVGEVAYAIWEPSGQLSVIQQPDRQPLRPADLGMDGSDGGLPIVLVSDGRPDPSGFRAAGLDRRRLERLLAGRGVQDLSDVLLATVNQTGELYVQLKKAAGGGHFRLQTRKLVRE